MKVRFDPTLRFPPDILEVPATVKDHTPLLRESILHFLPKTLEQLPELPKEVIVGHTVRTLRKFKPAHKKLVKRFEPVIKKLDKYMVRHSPPIGPKAGVKFHEKCTEKFSTVVAVPEQGLILKMDSMFVDAARGMCESELRIDGDNVEFIKTPLRVRVGSRKKPVSEHGVAWAYIHEHVEDTLQELWLFSHADKDVDPLDGFTPKQLEMNDLIAHAITHVALKDLYGKGIDYSKQKELEAKIKPVIKFVKKNGIRKTFDRFVKEPDFVRHLKK